MKRLILGLVVALMLMAGTAFADSDSWIIGSIEQGSGAITLPTWHNASDMFGSAGAAGSQLGGASFYAHPSSPSGENAVGNAGSLGSVIVNADVTHVDGTSVNSWANGTVHNEGYVNVAENGGLVPTATTSLYGTGSLELGTFASMGAGIDGKGEITNGGWAGASGNGSFGFNASGGSGWAGYGDITGNLSSTVTKLPNGYESKSSANIHVVVCPK
jgi:hypothetical protein